MTHSKGLKKRMMMVFTSTFVMLTIIVLIIVFYHIESFSILDDQSSIIVTSNDNNLNEQTNVELPSSNLIDVNVIAQNPELPRGCEVTSLTMLLQHAGVTVDKLTLAKEIKKDDSIFQIVEGRIYYGNPDYGYVGSMYSLSKPGLGVYHEPIYELLYRYLSDQAIDLTGKNFEDVLAFLGNDIPVWVITNTKYKELETSSFQTWYTSYGTIQITYSMHSVLLTGYDKEYIYFNDPLTNTKNKKVALEDFEIAWKQMGRQAVSYIPENLFISDILQ